MNLFFLYFLFLFVFSFLYYFHSMLMLLLSFEFAMLFVYFFLYTMSSKLTLGFLTLVILGCFLVLEAVLGLVFFLTSFRFYGSSYYFLW